MSSISFESTSAVDDNGCQARLPTLSSYTFLVHIPRAFVSTYLCQFFLPSPQPATFDHPSSVSTSTTRHKVMTSAAAVPIDPALYLPESDFSISPTPVNISGGCSEIYLGVHVRFGKVAMKRLRLDPSRIQEAMEREAIVWSGLKNPHVLEFHGICKSSPWIYLVSPFVENGSARTFLKLNPDADRPKLLYETALAVEYLHGNGVIHGDLKGDNILVSEKESALLCDFGLSRSNERDTSSTRRGKGTLRWMSPELLNGAAKSFASDVYALGMTICEVLSGNVPFDDCKLDVTVLRAIIEKKRPPKEPQSSRSGSSYRHLWFAAERAWAEEAGLRPPIGGLLPLFQPPIPQPFLELGMASAPINELAACVTAVGNMHESTPRLSVFTARCKILVRQAACIVIDIQREWTRMVHDPTTEFLQDAIDVALRTCITANHDFAEWSRHGLFKTLRNRGNIELRLSGHEANFGTCRELIMFAVHDRQYQAQNNPPCTISEIEAIVEAALAAATPRTAHEEPPRLRSTSNDLPFFIPVDLLIGGVLQGAAVGSGSNNDVWKGVWLGMINVALTRCWDSRFVVEDKGAITRFLRRMETWRTLDNPYVLKLHGLGKLDGNEDIYFVTPWLDSKDIMNYLATHRTSPRDLLNLIREILLGIQYLHTKNVLHGSMQPSNVLIEEHGRAVVSDFSLAKPLGSNATNTHSGTPTNQLRYQAPEINEGQPMTAAADVYSWAMTSLQVVSGSAPYHIYQTAGQTMKAILADRQLPQPTHHECEVFTAYPTLWNIFNSCWNSDPEERLSVETILCQLDDILPKTGTRGS